MKKKYFVTIILTAIICTNASARDAVDTVRHNSFNPETYALLDSVLQAYEEMENTKKSQMPKRPHALEGFTNRWQIQGAWNNCEGAPSQQYTLNFGMLNTSSSTGYWRGGFERSIRTDDKKIWGYGCGLDWMRCLGNGDRTVMLNQLYAEVRYRQVVGCIGMKQQMEDLGLGRMPLWQIRLSTNGYTSIPGSICHVSDFPLSVKGNIAYGLTNGQSWNQIFLGRPHEGFHEKQGISGGVTLRYGRPLIVSDQRFQSWTVESGVQTGFGGRDNWKGFYRWSTILTLTRKEYDIKVFDTHFFGKVSCLWSPLYLAGTNFQGIGLTIHNPVGNNAKTFSPLISFSVSEHNLSSWMIAIAGTTRAVCSPEFCIDYNVRYSFRPTTIRPLDSSFRNNIYTKSDIQHGLYASLSYEFPFHTIHGVFLDCAYAWDILRDGSKDRKGVQVMLTWRRSL